MLTLLGPTASGKTTLAAHLAHRIGGEIISADSRQVYRRMDIGTGKDLSDYVVEGQAIPYHLIDICEPGERYNLFRYTQDFQKAYDDITSRGRIPILCGGTGLYIEAVLRGYYSQPGSLTLRGACDAHSSLFTLHSSLIFGLMLSRDERRARISRRLDQRLQEGMVEEVDGLLRSGVSAERLLRYGLEYRYVTLYLLGQLTYEQMHDRLEIAIHQFAKRQMTWFRGMEERRGIPIHWIDALLPTAQQIEIIMQFI